MRAAALTVAEAARLRARKREPNAPRIEHGTIRAEFEAVTAPNLWQAVALGRAHSGAFMLATPEARHAAPVQASFTPDDFACRELAPGLVPVTYRLAVGGCRSRCATAMHIDDRQGFLVSEE